MLIKKFNEHSENVLDYKVLDYDAGSDILDSAVESMVKSFERSISESPDGVWLVAMILEEYISNTPLARHYNFDPLARKVISLLENEKRVDSLGKKRLTESLRKIHFWDDPNKPVRKV